MDKNKTREELEIKLVEFALEAHKLIKDDKFFDRVGDQQEGSELVKSEASNIMALVETEKQSSFKAGYKAAGGDISLIDSISNLSTPKPPTNVVEGLKNITSTYDLPRPITTLPKNFDPSTIITNGSLNHGEK